MSERRFAPASKSKWHLYAKPGDMDGKGFALSIDVPNGTIKRWVGEGMPVRRVRDLLFVDPIAARMWITARGLRIDSHRSSVVYFVRRADGAVKIGWTSDLERRLRELRKESRTTITLLAAIPGDKPDELRLQKRFVEYAIGDEWFTESPKIIAFVTSIRQVSTPTPTSETATPPHRPCPACRQPP